MAMLAICLGVTWPLIWPATGTTSSRNTVLHKGLPLFRSANADVLLVDRAIPLLTGPATMSTVLIYADKARDVWQTMLLVGYGLVIALATVVCLSLAGPIARVLGQTGINVMTRLMGLILAALAVEVMADGLQSLFTYLAGKVGR